MCPQQRDYREIAAAGLAARYRVHVVGEDLDATGSVEPQELLERCDPIPAAGVLGTKDRSALLAALVAQRKGLPGPSPPAVVRCQLKPLARALGRAAVPDATPGFTLLGVGPPPAPPFFVKPVVGRLSQHARRIDALAQLAALEVDEAYVEGYARLAALAGVDPRAVWGYLAEELLAGDEVTVEGYVHAGAVTVIGATDSVKYPGTNSFERFEYPSAQPPARLAELRETAARLVTFLGLDEAFFNVEFFVPAEGPARVTEVNARIASQFAPLVAAVDGRSTYDALFALACGEDPRWRPAAGRGVALSYCLRVFEDAWVRSVPQDADLELLVQPGLRLSEQGVNDEQSYRLCIFTVWGATRAEAVARARARAAALPFELEPCTEPSSGAGTGGA